MGHRDSKKVGRRGRRRAREMTDYAWPAVQSLEVQRRRGRGDFLPMIKIRSILREKAPIVSHTFSVDPSGSFSFSNVACRLVRSEELRGFSKLPNMTLYLSISILGISTSSTGLLSNRDSKVHGCGAGGFRV